LPWWLGGHLLVRDPVGGAVDRATVACGGAHLLVPGPWPAPKVGREPMIGFRLPSIGSLRLG